MRVRVWGGVYIISIGPLECVKARGVAYVVSIRPLRPLEDESIE